MANFRITAGYAGDKTIEAHHFEEVGSLIIFYSGGIPGPRTRCTRSPSTR